MKAATRARKKATAIQLLLASWVVFCFARATPAEPSTNLTVLPGFKVTPIYSVPPEQGSWICMAVDPKGRVLVSPQIASFPSITPFEPTLFRLTITDQKVSHIEKIQKQISEPEGMLYAFDSLYVNGKGPEGMGIYRLRQRGDDDFEDPELLRLINYSGEHGSHALVLGPDKKIYIPSGNYVDHREPPPNKISSASPFNHFGEDQLTSRYPDVNIPEGAPGSPGGTIARIDPNGRDLDIFCAGTRNIYDIAFNPDGELFGFDNDHEWDWGTPWYRPCRLYHLVSAGDYGFREGNGKLPDYDEDILPATKDVSIGAPSGIKFGTGTKFPEKYRRALFLCDWNFGRIFAAHLQPKGASYTCEVENIVRGTPLNVTDIEVTPDGAMCFITGGHNTKSTLYRLDYTNTVNAANVGASKTIETDSANLRFIRHQLEAFHGEQKRSAVDTAWPSLGHADRNIRYAARVAIESQPVHKWQDRALTETNRVATLTALMALARVGDKSVQPSLLQTVSKFPLSSLSSEEALLKLRVLELSFIRQGRPAAAVAGRIAAELSLAFPSKSEPLTRALCQLLIYLGDPSTIGKTLQLAHQASTRESQIYYLCRLSSATNGWTMDQRRDYFHLLRASSRPAADLALVALIKDAGIEYSDGGAFDGYIKAFRNESIKSLILQERLVLDPDIFEPVSARMPASKRFVRK